VHDFTQIPYTKADGITNMATDAALFEVCHRNQVAAVRFYGWTAPAVTFGYSQSYLSVPQLAREALPCIRRISGGGIVFHDKDLTYVLVLPPNIEMTKGKPAEIYAAVHHEVAASLDQWNVPAKLAPCPNACKPSGTMPDSVCFIAPQLHDVIAPSGKKLAGAAMRRSGSTILFQGSILLPSEIPHEAFGNTLANRLQSLFDLKNPVPIEVPAALRAKWHKQFSSSSWNQKR
jgi:lipoate-protein ligase A